MKIESNKQLKTLNTFGVEATAKYFVVIKSKKDLGNLVETKEYINSDKKIILGGGSNVLFVNNFNGMVIKNDIKGIKKLSPTQNNNILVEFGAGENWDKAVLWCVKNNIGGIENLSYVPGTVGAAPVQNIGAYGVELNDVFDSLEAYDLKNKKVVKFKKEECNFGYRYSIFKSKEYSEHIITKVVLKLTTKNHRFNTEYTGLKDQIEGKETSLKKIRDTVIDIRKSKLADPSKIGNAGSFFKNPVVPKEKYDQLKKVNEEIPGFLSDNNVKLSAGWLIDQCGFKGKTYGNVGVYKNHALVLVNYSNGTGKDLYKLKERIKKKVNSRFGILLEEEVKIIT